MSQVFVSKICRKGAIYMPKRLMESLGVKEGDRVLMKVGEGNRVVLEFVPDPISLALKTRKWAKTTVKEFERESVKEQYELYG